MHIKIISIFLSLLSNSLFFNTTEELYINDDGSGSIEMISIRDESKQMKFMGEDYNKEQDYKNETYTVKDVIVKENDTFKRFTKQQQARLTEYENIIINEKESSIDKEYKTTVTQNFKSATEILEIGKTMSYLSRLRENFFIDLDKEIYKLKYSYDGKVFKRNVIIANKEELALARERNKNLDLGSSLFSGLTYTFRYHFPRKVKSVSNPDARIIDEGKTVEMTFLLDTIFENPEKGSFEVILN